MTIFTTPNFTTRQFTNADNESFYLLNSNEDVVRHIRPVKDRAGCEAFLQEQLQDYQVQPLIGRWLVEDKLTKQFIGTFSVLFMQGDIDYHIGYALMPEHWGKGYATELLAEGVQYFFTNFTNKQLFAITQPENIASEKVLLKVGFTLCGSITREDDILNLLRYSL